MDTATPNKILDNNWASAGKAPEMLGDDGYIHGAPQVIEFSKDLETDSIGDQRDSLKYKTSAAVGLQGRSGTLTLPAEKQEQGLNNNLVFP